MDNRKITIDDIARELNISKTTVSRAISGKGRIGRETRERVLEFINQTGYRPSAIAKGLAKSKTFNIAFAMPGESKFVDLPFFQKCMWGIINEASGQDYDVLLCVVGEKDITGLERLVDNHKVDGVILGRTYEKSAAEKYLTSNSVPYVTIGTSGHRGAIQIDNDHVSACCELTTRLLSKGMTRIAVIGGKTEHIVNQNRLEGFRLAHARMGVTADEKLIITGSSEAEKVEQAVDTIMNYGADCIVCTDDSVCNVVLNRLLALRVEIPKDIKVASFYNSSTLDHYKPSVTSLEFDAIEAGRLSCKILLGHINNIEVEKKTLLGYDVIMRESTGD